MYTLKGDGWERLHITATMEAGESLGMVARHAIAQPFAVWLDQFQLEPGDQATVWQAPVVTKNRLTYNQATVELDVRGLIAATDGGTAPTLPRDTPVAWQGTASLKIAGDGSRAGQGLYTWSAFVTDMIGTYTGSVYVKGTPGDEFYFTLEEKGPAGTGALSIVEGAPFKLTSADWERHSFTTGMHAGQPLAITVRHAIDSPFTVWLDGFQLEKGKEATEWVAPTIPSAGTR